MQLQRLSLVFLPFLSLISASTNEQTVMGSIHDPFVPQKHPQPTLSDLLTIEQSASIFYSYARELELSRRFGEEDGKLTLFVPTNKAVMALARKPHQGQGVHVIPDDVHISEEDYEKKAKENVQRWVSSHIIPEYPISFDTKDHPTLLDGKSLSFKPIPKHDVEEPEWTRFTLDGGHIISMKEARNGVIYLIDSAISSD